MVAVARLLIGLQKEKIGRSHQIVHNFVDKSAFGLIFYFSSLMIDRIEN